MGAFEGKRPLEIKCFVMPLFFDILDFLMNVMQSQGEERISSSSTEYRMSNKLLLVEWRRMCERLYKYMTLALSAKGFGNGVSAILSDSLCNRHITSTGCFERPVRLPAALKAAKEIGAGSSDKIQLFTSIGEEYLELAEKKVVGKAHSKTYLKRIKKKCMSVPSDKEVVPLTENSDGQGGEDTSKCTHFVWNSSQ